LLPLFSTSLSANRLRHVKPSDEPSAAMMLLVVLVLLLCSAISWVRIAALGTR
jgi:hypothetical protein